jgi:hypothetical protein
MRHLRVSFFFTMNTTYKFTSTKEHLTDAVTPWEFRTSAKLVAGFSVTLEASNFLTTMASARPLTTHFEYPDMAPVSCSPHAGFVLERQWSNRDTPQLNGNSYADVQSPCIDLGFDCSGTNLGTDSLESLIILSLAQGGNTREPLFGLFLHGIDCFRTISSLTLSFYNYLHDLLKSNDIPFTNTKPCRQQFLPCLDMIPNRILSL